MPLDGAVGPQNHELFRIADRQQAQQHAVDQRKDRRVSPDAERQRPDRDRGEPRALDEETQGVPEVLENVIVSIIRS